MAFIPPPLVPPPPYPGESLAHLKARMDAYKIAHAKWRKTVDRQAKLLLVVLIVAAAGALIVGVAVLVRYR